MTSDTHIRWPAGCTPESSRVFAQNIINIAASPEVVWSLLIDCKKWPSWYKHCSDVSILQGGGPLLTRNAKFRFKTIGYYFEPEITIFEPPCMLVWSAKGPVGTSGAHAWYIEATKQGCRVVTEEVQNGLLLILVGSRARENLLKSHEEWLRALKALAEAK